MDLRGQLQGVPRITCYLRINLISKISKTDNRHLSGSAIILMHLGRLKAAIAPKETKNNMNLSHKIIVFSTDSVYNNYDSKSLSICREGGLQ